MVRESLGDIHVLYEPCSPMKRGSAPSPSRTMMIEVTRV
jgi:hypothetical protein